MNVEDKYEDRISVSIRSFKNSKNMLLKARNKYPEKYSSESHQIRAYIIRGLKEDGIED